MPTSKASKPMRYTPTSIVPGRQVYIESVPLATLQIDPAYQRPVDEHYVAYLVEHWDPTAVGLLTVSYREGRIPYLPDGQHRYLGGLRKGITHLTGLCYYDLSQEEEAQLFLHMNPSHTPTHSDRHRAALTANDPISCAVQQILDRYDLKVWYERAGRMHGEHQYIQCLAMLKRLYGWLGETILDMAIGSSTYAWPTGSEGRQARVIRGLAHFIALYHEENAFNFTHLVNLLGSNDCHPRRLIVAATEYEQSFHRHGIGIAHALVNHWNTHYPTARLSLDHLQTLGAYVSAHQHLHVAQTSPQLHLVDRSA